MNTSTTIEHGQQRIEALQREATRLADQARDQLTEYARTFDLSTPTKFVQSAAADSRKQIDHAAAEASDYVTTAMAAALEDAAGQLRTYPGTGAVAQVAHTAAGALEHGSDALQPWSTRSMLRRTVRVMRQYPFPTLLVSLAAVGAIALARRNVIAHTGPVRA